MQRLGMVIRSLHIYYIVCRVPRFGVRFGLGLAIAQSIAQTHGGSIGCTSAEGVTQFTVTLPLLKNEPRKNSGI